MYNAPLWLNLIGAIPTGFILIDRNRRVIMVNDLASEILRHNDGLWISRGILTTDNRTARQMIQACADNQDAGPHVMPIPRRQNGPLLIRALPYPGINAESEMRVAIIISDPQLKPHPDTEVLRRMFGLTHAEAMLAALILIGHSLAEAAANLGIKQSTARTHLKHLMHKTGTERQNELIYMLLCSCAVLDVPEPI